MRAYLIPMDGGNPVEVQKELMLVGRHSDCDLRLDDKTVSKLHCVLVKLVDMLLLRDLGSTNGCRVNGQRVKRAALLHKDVVSIANTRFRVEYAPGESPLESPAPAPSRRPDTTEMFDVDQIDEKGFGQIKDRPVEGEKERDFRTERPRPRGRGLFEQESSDVDI
jgi:pSer/pThr/pTyr-binding forkhead associated (FHA) protein